MKSSWARISSAYLEGSCYDICVSWRISKDADLPRCYHLLFPKGRLDVVMTHSNPGSVRGNRQPNWTLAGSRSTHPRKDQRSEIDAGLSQEQ